MAAQLCQLLRISGADDGADRAVTARAGGLDGQLLDVLCDVSIHRTTIGREILKLPATRIRCFDQHEQSGLTCLSGDHERFEAIATEIRAHRERVGLPATLAPSQPSA